MPIGETGFRKQKLAKAALAKSNTVVADLSGISGQTVARLASLSQSLGVVYDGNNNVNSNDTNDRLDALEADGVATNVATILSGTYSATTADKAVLAAGDSTIVLPNPLEGYEITIKKTNLTGTVTINPNGLETIEGATSAQLVTQYEALTLITDGMNWFII